MCIPVSQYLLKTPLGLWIGLYQLSPILLCKTATALSSCNWIEVWTLTWWCSHHSDLNNSHIKIKSAYYRLKNISKIKGLMSQQDLEKICLCIYLQ